MSGLQSTIAQLTFVAGKPGNLRMWEPPCSGMPIPDFRAGRWGAAGLVATIRKFKNPTLLYHVDRAWREQPRRPESRYYEAGFRAELARTIRLCPLDHFQLLRSAHLNFPKDDKEAALAMLPGVQVLASGRCQQGRVVSSQDYGELVEAGKFYASALCRFLIQTGDVSTLASRGQVETVPGMEPLFVGWCHVLSEVLMSAPCASRYQVKVCGQLALPLRAHNVCRAAVSET